MPQDSETGRQGIENGYNHADEIGALLNARRVSNNSNEFDWKGSRVVIKTGSSAVVTRALLIELMPWFMAKRPTKGVRFTESSHVFLMKIRFNPRVAITMKTTDWCVVPRFEKLASQLFSLINRW